MQSATQFGLVLVIAVLIAACLASLVVHAHPRAKNGIRQMLFAATPTIPDLYQKLADLTAQAKAVQDRADAENRQITTEEENEISGIMAAFDITEADIKRRERIAAQESKVNQPRRHVEPSPTTASADGRALVIPEGARIEGGYKPGASKGTGGYVSEGEFALSVKAAVGGSIDPRLRVLAVAPSTQNMEGQGADGGYLVPPDFRTAIWQKVNGEDSLLGRTDAQTTSGNSIVIPIDETTPWQTSGGVQVYWEGEGTQLGQSKLAMKSVPVRTNKVSALVAVTDEMLEDAPSLTAFLQKKIGEKINYKINDALVNGDGVGKPLGILQSPALVTQTKVGGQAAGTVVAGNIASMWSRMYAPLRRNAVWLINQDIEAQLPLMTIGTSNAAPVYMPPNGLAGAPNGTLMGRPIVYTEAAAGVGTAGDITLVDFSQYLSITKSSGVRSDVSIHLWFDYSVTAFRFTLRIGGMPWWSTSIARAKSALPLSFAVALEAR